MPDLDTLLADLERLPTLTRGTDLEGWIITSEQKEAIFEYLHRLRDLMD